MIEISENFSLKEYNTFGIDVTCKYFVKCDQESELLEFVGSYELDPEEILLLGGGSNFLFTENFDGVVFYPVMQGCEIVREDDKYVFVRVGSGVVWDDFVAWAVEHGELGMFRQTKSNIRYQKAILPLMFENRIPVTETTRCRINRHLFSFHDIHGFHPVNTFPRFRPVSPDILHRSSPDMPGDQ